VLEAMILDAFEGAKTRGAHRREMARMLRMAWWPNGKMTRAERSAAIWKAVRSASLVAEPARYIYACRPEWVALEQVPAVLPLWQVYAAELRRMGYSAWAGKLNSADYGVPQTRERAILIASRVRKVARPEPSHYDPRKGLQLWGTPWMSMAEALGMGATSRPAPTVTAGGTATGGAEPFGHRDRDALTAERDAGRWALRVDAQRNATLRSASAPAPALKFGHSAAEMQWVLHESQFAVDSVRITVEEAAALQSMPPWYPWQGTKTAQFRQVGDLFPPLAAIAVLGVATGADWQPVAEQYASVLYGREEAA
jgi:DNA (cytosine-5)-methyltransferase 1